MTPSPAIQDGFLSDPTDLSQLTHIDPVDVTELVIGLNDLPEEELIDHKSFVAIGTGGTLSMRVDDNGIRVPDLNFADIFKRTDASLFDRFHIEGLDAFKIDSAQMNYDHIRDLAIAICHLWHHCSHRIDGFLILHGTDTLSDSGAALSLMMGQGLPFSIVYTAAQKSIQEPMNDAANNIRNALFTLEALHDNDMAEVISVMGDHAYLSSSAIKVDDQNMNALRAPLHDAVCDYSMLDYPVKLAPWLKPRRAQVAFKPTIWQGRYGHTLIVRSHIGLCPDMIEQQINSTHVGAVLLYSYGAGTIYNGILDSVTKAAAVKNCPVFIVSPVDTSYKVCYESARTAIDAGVIPLHMTLPAALAKIEIALRLHTDDRAALTQFMTQSYVGEMPHE